MLLELNGCAIELTTQINDHGTWRDSASSDPLRLEIKEEKDFYSYTFAVDAPYETQARLTAKPVGASDIWHLIPCCIYGDNNARLVHKGEFPVLTFDTQDDVFRSPRWEFRADRAAMPFSAICTESGTLAISVDPYSDTEKGEIHNGVFSELPDLCGITLGYTNDPITFINKREPGESTSQFARHAAVSGRIYFEKADDPEFPRQSAHKVVRREYALRHETPSYKKSYIDAVRGCLNSFVTIDWDPAAKEYTNCNCLPPANNILHPWRNVKEIGWTGGGVLAYPLILSETVLGDEAKEMVSHARSGAEMFDRIAAVWNEKSGLLYDLTSPIDESGSMVNGWWSGFGLTKDVHSSYNVGSGVHYMLKTIVYLQSRGENVPPSWMDSARKTLDTVIELQRQDGAFGYTYRIDRKEVADWEGFAGCWFVPCCAYMYHITGERKYLDAAERALAYYEKAVDTLTCNGTPMDTWKSPDEEGNLAFIRGARLLHEYTGEEKYLTALKRGAEYEMLWRFGHKTHPENYPINDGWNSCGGSITSVSNPHIHPMGMIVDSDLYYLAKVTGDPYFENRAEDGTAWIMQTLELYPEKTGYGAYGVLSERWCPSDGLVIQRTSEGKPYSSWFSYNLWAAAAAFEEACERALGL